ncbi:MAG TPA: hypothetical protein VI864_04755 [Candidatus Bathyarchaeia archaeon]|nr:hypothetical protein [Candidatus Bathyarchaeia archaeon]
MAKRMGVTKENIPIIVSVASLILSIISVGFSVYVGNENLSLERENSRLTNFAPSIFSNYTYSILEASNYMRNESFAIFWGFVKIDLTVLASQYSKIVVSLKLLNYSGNTNFWLDLETQSGEFYSNKIVYENFVERGFNPIVAGFDLFPMIAVKSNSINADIKGFGFRLGEVTLEAKLIDLVTNQAVLTQEFNEGISISVKVIG